MANDRVLAQIYLALTDAGESDCVQSQARLDDEDLAALVDGSLSAERGAGAIRHLASCPDCSQRYAQVREAVAFTAGAEARAQADASGQRRRAGALAPWWRWLGLGAGGVLAAWVYIVVLAPATVFLQPGLEQDLRAVAGTVDAGAQSTLMRGGAPSGAAATLESTQPAHIAFMQRGLDAGYLIAWPGKAVGSRPAATACIQADSLETCGADERRAYEVGLWIALTDAWCASAGENDIHARQLQRLNELREAAQGSVLAHVDLANAQSLCASTRQLAARITDIG